MKKSIHILFILLVTALTLFTHTVLAQAPQAIPYQAVARDNTGATLANQAIALRISIHDTTATGTIVYQETHMITTNSLGLFNVNIGQGTAITGTLSGVNWANGSKFIQVEMDPTGGTSYTDMGTTQLMSVPYALSSADNQWTKSGNDISSSNTGNVGIGTTTPTSKLTIDENNSGAVNTILEMKNTNNGFTNAATISLKNYYANERALQFVNWNSNTDPFASTYSDAFTFNNINGAILTMDQGGNVGIGNQNPDAKLDINGNIRISGGNPGVGKVLTSDAYGTASWQSLSSIVETDPQVSSTTTNKVPKWNGTTLTDGSISDVSGVVGIGRNTPDTDVRLHLGNAGSSATSTTLRIGNYQSFYDWWSGSYQYYDAYADITCKSNLYNSNDRPLQFWNKNPAATSSTRAYEFLNQSGSTIFSILESGNVGVGHSSPTAKMDILGNIKIKDGTEGIGKVLTSDANGLASWTTTIGGVVDLSTAQTVAGIKTWTNNAVFNSNVGIKTSSPAGELDVKSTFTGTPIIDQQQTSTYGGTASLSVWQSFTAGVTGNLTSLDIKLSSPIGSASPSPMTIKIYSGQGNIGTLLTTLTATVQGLGSNYQTYTFSNPLLITSGNQYTFELSVPSMNVTWIDFSNANPYAGGLCSINANYDLQFKTYVAPTSQVSALTVVNGKVGIGNTVPTTKLDILGNVKIADGTEGVGKVLTSDATGISSWQTPVSETDPQVSSTATHKIPKWDGTTLTDGVITDDGTNIGIGTSTPSAKLDVNGTIKISGGNPAAGKILTSDATGIASWQTPDSETDPQVSSTSTNKIPKWNGTALIDGIISDDGSKVGIGTTTPTARFSIAENNAGAPNTIMDLSNTFNGFTNTAIVSLKNFNVNDRALQFLNSNSSATATTNAYTFLNNTASAIFTIQHGGRVGIGTTTPVAPLDVSGTAISTASLNRVYFNVGGASLVNNTAVSGQIQVRANGYFWADNGGFVATSDQRIKNKIGLTNTQRDLNDLSKIEITNYKYIDEINNGSKLHKKVIAQQLNSVYPLAVDTTKGIIPNVYEVAKHVSLKNNSTLITTNKAHDFKTGDEVKLIIENVGEKLVHVEVIDEHTFSVNEIIKDKVFVFGKHIDDLLIVDYDALTTLNISATQELFKRIESLETENGQLKASNTTLKEMNETNATKILSIEAKLNLILQTTVTAQK